MKVSILRVPIVRSCVSSHPMAYTLFVQSFDFFVM